VNTVFS